MYILICQKYAALRRIFDPIRIDDTYRVSDQMYRDTYRIVSSKRYTTLVGSSRQRHAITNDNNIDVLLSDEILTEVDSFSYLGVKLDAHLTWNEQVDDVCKKLVFMVAKLRRLKSVLEPRILMYIYNSIIQPRIDYAICA